MQRLLDTLQVPALVLGRRADVLAHNALAAALLSGFRERNMLRHVFLDEGSRDLYPEWERVAADTVGYVRLQAGEHPDDAQLVELIGELSLHSEDFRRVWARHDVKSKNFGTKRFAHPLVGPLELQYESLALPDPDQTLITYTAAPGSASETALTLLGTLGRDEDRRGLGDDDRVLEVRRR